MRHRQRVCNSVIAALGLALLALSQVASAQSVANPFGAIKPADGIPGGDNAAGSGVANAAKQRLQSGNLTPEQIRSIMMYRALQSRGRGQVKRGVPMFVPLGGPAFFPYSQSSGAADDGADDEAKKEARKQRLIEARKAAEEKRRAAREARIAKRKQEAAQARRDKAAAINPPAKDDKPAAGGN